MSFPNALRFQVSIHLEPLVTCCEHRTPAKEKQCCYVYSKPEATICKAPNTVALSPLIFFRGMENHQFGHRSMGIEYPRAGIVEELHRLTPCRHFYDPQAVRTTESTSVG